MANPHTHPVATHTGLRHSVLMLLLVSAVLIGLFVGSGVQVALVHGRQEIGALMLGLTILPAFIFMDSVRDLPRGGLGWRLFMAAAALAAGIGGALMSSIFVRAL